MAANIRNIEFSNEKGQICTNLVWVSNQTADLTIKMGAEVDKPNPEYDPTDNPNVNPTIKVQEPYKMYLSIMHNCKNIALTAANPESGYDSSLITVDESDCSVTFLKPGKCMFTVVGNHHDGTSVVKTWKFNVLSQDWTQDVTDPNTGTTTQGDYPRYVDRDTQLEVTPSYTLQQVGDIVQYEVYSNCFNAGTFDYRFSVAQEHENKVVIDNTKNTVKAVKGGKFEVMLGCQFRQAKVATWRTTYEVFSEEPFEPEDDAVVIQLYNKTTQRTTKLVTSNNKSEEDVTFVLPEESGTLVTEMDLKKNISIIEKPTIIEPVTGITEHIGDIISSPFQTLMGAKDTHARSTWQISDNETFDKVYMEKVESFKNNLCKFNPGIMAGAKFWVRVKYHSDRYDSFWSDPVEITFGGHGYDSLKKPTKYVNPDNVLDGAYYGVVPHDELVDNYDYRGTYNTIKNAVEVDTNNTVTKYKDYGQNMKKGYQVLHPKNGETELRLWYAKKDFPSDIFRRNPPGDTASEYWALDERDNLCTPYHLVDRVGVGIIDPFRRVPTKWWNRNTDGYSTGPNFLKELCNHEEGWVKFTYNGRILYTTKKPICRQIAWTDLAKRDVVYGNRTLRIGRRLYWVRLLTEKEYSMLFTALTNGTFESWKKEDMLLSDKCWIEDFQESPVRYRMTDINKRETADPKYRQGSWRPVLELIAEGAEPYNNLPDCPQADNEIFQYDSYSDTGYFGVVPYGKIKKADEVMTEIGFSGGSNQFLDAGYLKFYWHGRILYMNKKTIRYNVSWNNSKNCHAVHGVDMGGTGKKVIVVNHNGTDYKMPVSHIIHSRLEPWTQDWFDGRSIPKITIGQDGSQSSTTVQNQTELQKHTLDADVGKYSPWQELMYRVGVGYFGFTEVNNDGTQWTDSYMELHGGYQKGDNWASFPTTELQVKYDSDGNGTLQWGRDIGSEKRHVFNRDSASIKWPAEPTNPTTPDGQPGTGSTTDANLTEWCKKHNVDVTWFKGKYTNWATVTITEDFVKQVATVEKEAMELEVNYAGPTADRVNYCGYRGLARWNGDVDFSDAGANCGLRLLHIFPTDRARIER